VTEAQAGLVAPRLRSASLWLSCAALGLAVSAAVLVVTYLRPASNGTWVNLVLAVAVLFAPLAARSPWSRRRLNVGALVWAGLGAPGAYVFGSFAFYAGVLLGVALMVDQLARRVGVGVPGVALRSTELRRPS
jgi:hypothetical protein